METSSFHPLQEEHTAYSVLPIAYRIPRTTHTDRHPTQPHGPRKLLAFSNYQKAKTCPSTTRASPGVRRLRFTCETCQTDHRLFVTSYFEDPIPSAPDCCCTLLACSLSWLSLRHLLLTSVNFAATITPDLTLYHGQTRNWAKSPSVCPVKLIRGYSLVLLNNQPVAKHRPFFSPSLAILG